MLVAQQSIVNRLLDACALFYTLRRNARSEPLGQIVPVDFSLEIQMRFIPQESFRVAYKGINSEFASISLRFRRNRVKFAIQKVYSLCTQSFSFAQVDH